MTTTETKERLEAQAHDQLDLRGWTIENTVWTLQLERQTPVHGNETIAVKTYVNDNNTPTGYTFTAREGGHHIDTGDATTIDGILEQIQVYLHDHPQQ